MEPGTYLVSARPLPAFLGTCVTCPRPVRVNDDTATGDAITRPCIDCSSPVRLERLYGTVAAMSCHSECMGAAGPSCSCSCGGINHGGRWSKAGHMIASELQAYRDGIAKREAERQQRAEAERRKRVSAFERWRGDGNQQLVSELLATDWWEGKYPNSFLADMADIVRCHKILSERQAAAAERILAKRRDAAARQERERAERAANAADVPTGRHTVTGEVVGTYERDNPFTYHESATLCIVVWTGQWRVRGTCPKSITWHKTADGQVGIGDLIRKGDRVTFSAELSPDGKEKGCGYFKRPTKAEFVS